ncbi:hypothetical protein [Amycolatopsis xylanica]|uniref:hypothetical protein n=1 Tax=Amycolatopsis xylanica TaxID=589385 RepID=UPI0015A49539|nr:hypothetical protein [Amycolatopsis xylanica]
MRWSKNEVFEEIDGRKRHIVTDNQGLLLATATILQDRAARPPVRGELGLGRWRLY